MEIIFAITILVGLYYFGSLLKSIAEKANIMADTRLEDLEMEQIYSSERRRSQITAKAEKMAERGQVSLSNQELRDLLRKNKEEK